MNKSGCEKATIVTKIKKFKMGKNPFSRNVDCSKDRQYCIVGHMKDIETILMTLYLAAALLMDLKKSRIPNIFILAGWVTFGGVALLKRAAGVHFIVKSIVGLIVLYPLYLAGALGAGDVKLLAVICGLYPAKKCFLIVYGALCMAALYGLILIIKDRIINQISEDHKVRFAVFIFFSFFMVTIGEVV